MAGKQLSERPDDCNVVKVWSRGGSSLLRVDPDPMAPNRVRVHAQTDFGECLLIFRRDELLAFAVDLIAKYGPR